MLVMEGVIVVRRGPAVQILRVLRTLTTRGRNISLARLSRGANVLGKAVFPVLGALIRRQCVDCSTGARLCGLKVSYSVLSHTFLSESC